MSKLISILILCTLVTGCTGSNRYMGYVKQTPNYETPQQYQQRQAEANTMMLYGLSMATRSPQYRTPVQTNCRNDGLGNYNCTTW